MISPSLQYLCHGYRSRIRMKIEIVYNFANAIKQFGQIDIAFSTFNIKLIAYFSSISSGQ